MSQYNEIVEYQRLKLAAEAWSKGVHSIHAHSLSSMWYDDRPQDTENGGVVDTQYNDNSIERTLSNGTKIWMVERPSIEKQMDLYSKYEYDQEKLWG